MSELLLQIKGFQDRAMARDPIKVAIRRGCCEDDLDSGLGWRSALGGGLSGLGHNEKCLPVVSWLGLSGQGDILGRTKNKKGRTGRRKDQKKAKGLTECAKPFGCCVAKVWVELNVQWPLPFSKCHLAI